MPLSESHQLVSLDDRNVSFSHQARASLVRHGEKILAEVPATLRRVRMVLLIVSISISAFLAGLLVLLWRLT